MANKYFRSEFLRSCSVYPVFLVCNAQFQGASAPIGFTTTGAVSSFTRTSTGVYVITLADRYNFSLYNNYSWQNCAGLSGLSDLTAYFTPNVNNASPTITVTFINDSGAVTDPPSGAIINFFLLLNNSSV